ncbi:MAG: FHA domain-containing protein [Phycisphaerae bacterium]|nr:FHA domain-containing protein [Phycisphaerae bacterium]
MQVNLVFLKKDGTASSFKLPSTVTFIGRRQDCDFCIPLMVVSRRHCEINMDLGKITIRDLRSRNGTFINGEPIEEAQVKAGDMLKIGPVEFVIQIDGIPESFEEHLQKKETTTQNQVARSADENFDDAMEDLSDVELGKSRTEMLGDLPDDFDEDFNL